MTQESELADIPEAESSGQRPDEAPLVFTILQIIFLPIYLLAISHAILTCTHPVLSVFYLGGALAELIGMGLVYSYRPRTDRIRMLEMLSACTGVQVMTLVIVLIWKLFWAPSGSTFLGVEVKKWAEITDTPTLKPTNDCRLPDRPGFGFFLCSMVIVVVVLLTWPYLTGFSWPRSLRSSENEATVRDPGEHGDDEDGEDVGEDIHLLRVDTTTKSNLSEEAPGPYSAGPPAYQ